MLEDRTLGEWRAIVDMQKGAVTVQPNEVVIQDRHWLNGYLV